MIVNTAYIFAPGDPDVGIPDYNNQITDLGLDSNDYGSDEEFAEMLSNVADLFADAFKEMLGCNVRVTWDFEMYVYSQVDLPEGLCWG